MYLKFCVILVLSALTTISSQEVDDDLSDFDFQGPGSSSTSPDDENVSGELFDENDLQDFDYTDENLQENKTQMSGGHLALQMSSREALVKQVILNSMKSKEMKNNMAKVLPILRAMTPDQKLALATLVTTQVLAPPATKGLSYNEVSALFGNNPNTTSELMLPISYDIANLFRRSARSEKGPTAEELRGLPPYMKPMRPGGPGVYRRNIIDRPLHNNKFMRPRKPIKSNNKEPANCELFTANICLKSHDYPIDSIMLSIRRNKHAMNALLTDVLNMPSLADGSTDIPETDTASKTPDDVTEFNEVRRTGGESGFMCPSVVRYARPQKARATSGQWKYIVNTADHTQTLRLERCLKAGDTCTYLTDNFKSRCVQVYNYHRLLTWDQTNGLHMDIFKVPTCCSCHIDSYKVPFPPHHANHATTSENFPGEDLDNEPSATIPSEPLDPYINSISNHNSNHYHKDLPQNVEYLDGESTKISATLGRPALPKYLEAPKAGQTFNKQNPYKRGTGANTVVKPVVTKPVVSKPQRRPIRRRQPHKPVRDLAMSESNFGSVTTNLPSTVNLPAKEFTKKINYNYHPIIDFFKPDHIESRMDLSLNLGDSDWKPVTSMFLATERTTFKKR